MHDFSTGRSGFDRVLAAVAATFLLTGTVTFAHADPAKPVDSSISAAVPTPDTSNVPPPTAADGKPDAAKTSAGTVEPAKAADAAKPADAPKADADKVAPAKSEPPKADSAMFVSVA